jgi:hypothetical protein
MSVCVCHFIKGIIIIVVRDEENEEGEKKFSLKKKNENVFLI